MYICSIKHTNHILSKKKDNDINGKKKIIILI